LCSAFMKRVALLYLLFLFLKIYLVGSREYDNKDDDDD